MPTTVFLSGHLKEFSGGLTELDLSGPHSTIGDVLEQLWASQPALRDRVLTDQSEIREHVNIFYLGRDAKRLDGLNTVIEPGGEIHIFNAVSGG